MKFLDRSIGALAYRLWDLKQGGYRLAEMRSLKEEQLLPRDKQKRLQDERLSLLLKHAQNTSPWYRELFEKHGIDVSSIKGSQDLTKLPVTTKQQIREHTDAFISSAYKKEDLVSAKTGGSTGVSLTLYFDELCQQKRNAAQGLADGWAGWKPGSRVAALWGNPPVSRSFKQRLRAFLLGRMIYLDTMAMTPQSVRNFADQIIRTKPELLFGHAHSIYLFAKFLRDERIKVGFTFGGIVATSMMLLDHERYLIEQVLGVKVTNRYGCEEVGLIACECEEHEGMHINSSHVIVECLDDNDQPVPIGETGKIVVTDLNNFGMPLIRYRVEDMGVLSDRDCRCDRSLPMLERLEGRVADFLKTPDGVHVAGVSLVERTLTKVKGIEQMQLVQPDIKRLEVNRVKAKEHDTQSDSMLLKELREVFDDRVEIEILDVDKIPQESSGKYRFAICRV